ncbi:hypothetical protein OESDEN_15964 [Oesophagostomum dentatum]|uniref:Uncharacterized protein n=1 Tax=Oesophagostomum dentatum TaxID=61180 RepID=A0A0B1SHB8_OESDE|nr:hypothetical protein OESDEN_15964 [Oesophagostomum dentatum]
MLLTNIRRHLLAQHVKAGMPLALRNLVLDHPESRERIADILTSGDDAVREKLGNELAQLQLPNLNQTKSEDRKQDATQLQQSKITVNEQNI